MDPDTNDMNTGAPGQTPGEETAGDPYFDPTISDSGGPADRSADYGGGLYDQTIADSPGRAAPGPWAYDVVREIGRGGMGKVHLGKDVRLGRWVAIKRLSEQLLSDAKLNIRFQVEAKAVAALNHFHIVQVYAFSEDEQGPYIAMEYVPGPKQTSDPDPSWGRDLPPAPLTLEQWVRNEGPLPIEDAASLGMKLCSALKYAHDHGIVHRDIKPANVLLNENLEPKLADFGLARRADVDGEGVTLAGAQLLTLGYGAPEQETDASKADHRADIYGLGGTLWYALTGQSPRFFRENEVPDQLRPVLTKALEKDRERRFQDAKEFERALQDHTASKSKTPPPKNAPLPAGYWRCDACSQPNSEKVQYCCNCGRNGLVSCSGCGKAIYRSSKHCGNCGKPLSGDEVETTRSSTSPAARSSAEPPPPPPPKKRSPSGQTPIALTMDSILQGPGSSPPPIRRPGMGVGQIILLLIGSFAVPGIFLAIFDEYNIRWPTGDDEESGVLIGVLAVIAMWALAIGRRRAARAKAPPIVGAAAPSGLMRAIRVFVTLDIIAFAGAWVLAGVEIETVLVTGVILTLLGAVTAILSGVGGCKPGLILGISHIGFCVLLVFLVNALDWSERDAYEPFLILGAIYAIVLMTPLSSSVFKSRTR